MVTMHYLENMAAVLLRWSDSHAVSRPLCIATAREMMLLAEAELKVGAMSRFAGSGSYAPTANDLQALYDTLRRSSRDIDEISRAVTVSSRIGSNVRAEHSSKVAEMAVQKLCRLAHIADQIGDFELSDGIDGLLSSIR